MSLMNDFNNCQSELLAWLMGIMFAILGAIITMSIYTFFGDKRDTYFHGQIDAIRGIIKWKLERNDDGEEIWTENK